MFPLLVVSASLNSFSVCVIVFLPAGIYTNPDAIWLEKLGFGSYVSQLESKCVCWL